MSKIKTNRLEPRATNGSLTIGNPDSYTTFEGDLNVPGYATEAWVEAIVTEDVALELSTYQKRVEKNRPLGYAGLDEDGMVPETHIPSAADKVSKSGDTMTGDLEMGMNNVSDVNHLSAWNVETVNGMSSEIGTMNTTGGNTGGWRFIDKNTSVLQIQNTGITSETGIDMSGNKITDLGDPVADSDAATKAYVDSGGGGTDEYVHKAGDTMTGDLDMGENKVILDSIELTGNRNISVESGFAGDLLYGGAQKLKWGNQVDIYSNLSVRNNKIVLLAAPEDDDDAANKAYVDSKVQPHTRLGRKFMFTVDGKGSTEYQKGDLFFTTENNVAYTQVFDEARFICFAWEDLHELIWRTAKLGSLTLPDCSIIIEYNERMMGWFDYENGVGSINSGNVTGSVVLPVSRWNSTTDQTEVTAGASYEIITQFWN